MKEMETGHDLRKQIKQKARKSLKKHYWIFLVACLFATVLGTQFSGSLDFIKQSIFDRGVREESQVISDDADDSETAGAVGLLISQKKQNQLLEDLFAGNISQAKNNVAENKQESTNEINSKVMGRTRGVFASVVNQTSSGSFIVTMIMAIAKITGSTSVSTIIFIVLALLLMIVIWFLIKNVYQVIMVRIFLEGRTYDTLRSQRFFFLYRVKGWISAAWTMFVMSVFYFLWCLTIIGGIIKHYSYRMVPFIVAENPSISALDAITLSRKMMNGHKWECFVLDLSFLGWSILGGLTGGITSLFFTNMYETATLTEYYAALRGDYLFFTEEDDREYLNDTYLFEKAPDDILLETYSDIVTELQEENRERVELTGFWGFIAKTFGIVLWNNEKEQAFNQQEVNALKLKNYVGALEGRVYPGRLFPMKEKEKRSRVEVVNYLRHYSVLNLIMIFFIMSFIGWVWEVSLHLVSDGVFVNRGVQYGPWLPIYGTGGACILILLNKFRKYPAVEFITAVILCGCVEYYTSYSLQMAHGGTKWWDYSGYFLNINGRVCAEGLLVFGLGGMAIVYALAPMLDNMLKKISIKILLPIAIILVIIFGIDKVYSEKHPNMGKGITSYTALEECTYEVVQSR